MTDRNGDRDDDPAGCPTDRVTGCTADGAGVGASDPEGRRPSSAGPTLCRARRLATPAGAAGLVAAALDADDAQVARRGDAAVQRRGATGVAGRARGRGWSFTPGSTTWPPTSPVQPLTPASTSTFAHLSLWLAPGSHRSPVTVRTLMVIGLRPRRRLTLPDPRPHREARASAGYVNGPVLTIQAVSRPHCIDQPTADLVAAKPTYSAAPTRRSSPRAAHRRCFERFRDAHLGALRAAAALVAARTTCRRGLGRAASGRCCPSSPQSSGSGRSSSRVLRHARPWIGEATSPRAGVADVPPRQAEDVPRDRPGPARVPQTVALPSRSPRGAGWPAGDQHDPINLNPTLRGPSAPQTRPVP